MAERQRTTDPTLFDNQILEKRCTRCDTIKPVTGFYKAHRAADGYTHACRECTRANSKRYRVGQAELAKTVTEKTCEGCDLTKPLKDFRVCLSGRFGRNRLCRKCNAAHVQVRDAEKNASPERRQKRSHKERVRLLRKYGMSKEDFAAMHQAQGGLCAICKQPENTGRPDGSKKPRLLCIDHDHTTGQVRSLLCSQCNHGIGNFRDDPELLKSAVAYLQRHGKI